MNETESNIDRHTVQPVFTEHYIDRGQGRVYARDYQGSGPAFVLMHGFPDNLHIYDKLIPCLAAAGRRIIAFDFLGFGASDKLPDSSYSFKQQLDDLEAVIDHLSPVKQIIPVAHDSSGPAAINFCLEHPLRVASLCLLNSAYDDAFPAHWPEMIELFATAGFKALSRAFTQSPEQFGWLLTWQQKQFSEALPENLKDRFESGIGTLIAGNFIEQPSSGPAFVQMTAQFFDELARNTKRLPAVEKLDIPVRIIWGELDPYITAAVARDRASHFKNVELSYLPGGHWVQSDLPGQVAAKLLS